VIWRGRGEVEMENGAQVFLENVAKVLGARQRPTVFCIVHSEMGLELLPTSDDLVMVLGMLDAARLKVVDMYGEHLETNREEVKRRESLAMAALGPQGKAN
jgi:hypothetical protein